MAALRVVDADSHVMEVEETWDYLEPEFAARRPQVVQTAVNAQGSPVDAFWLVDGQIQPRLLGPGATVSGAVSVGLKATGGTAPYTYRLRIDGTQVSSTTVRPSRRGACSSCSTDRPTETSGAFLTATDPPISATCPSA